MTDPAFAMDDELVTTVVRGLGYEVTHLVTVPGAALEPMAWPGPKYPFTGIRAPVVAACGTRVRSCQPVLVVMLPGSRVTCRYCVRITGIKRQPLTIQPQRQESP